MFKKSESTLSCSDFNTIHFIISTNKWKCYIKQDQNIFCLQTFWIIISSQKVLISMQRLTGSQSTYWIGLFQGCCKQLRLRISICTVQSSSFKSLSDSHIVLVNVCMNGRVIYHCYPILLLGCENGWTIAPSITGVKNNGPNNKARCKGC